MRGQEGREKSEEKTGYGAVRGREVNIVERKVREFRKVALLEKEFMILWKRGNIGHNFLINKRRHEYAYFFVQV